MDTKPRITYIFTALITFALLIFLMPFSDSAFSAQEEKTLYLLHVSSFQNRKAAEKEVSTFLEQGLQAFYQYEVVDGKGNWFRVYIGTFNNRQEATAKGVELMQMGIISYAAPRKVAPDFIPGRKNVEVERDAEEPDKPPVIEEEPPQAEIPPKPVAKPTEKTVQKPPAPEKKIEIDSKKKAETRPKREPLLGKRNFSLALNAGLNISSSAEDFKITEQTPSADRNFFFTGDAYQVSIEPGMRAYKDLHLYGRVEYVFVDNVDIFFVSLGPKQIFSFSDSVFPYIKGGMVWGDFSFDSAPGEFDDNFGYEAGFGLEILKSPLKLGLDFLYRDMEFDYIYSGIAEVTASDSSIDASGFSASGTFIYHF